MLSREPAVGGGCGPLFVNLTDCYSGILVYLYAVEADSRLYPFEYVTVGPVVGRYGEGGLIAAVLDYYNRGRRGQSYLNPGASDTSQIQEAHLMRRQVQF